MTSLTDLADVVIGVDTHVETHSAAVVDAGTGAVLHELRDQGVEAGAGVSVTFATSGALDLAQGVEGCHGGGRLSRFRNVPADTPPRLLVGTPGGSSDPFPPDRPAP
jgi:hypothetical protein